MDRYLMNALCAVSLVALVAMGAGAALASSNKIVLMPGDQTPFWTCPAFVESVFDFTLPAVRTEAG
jgi:hypothetical protein